MKICLFQSLHKQQSEAFLNRIGFFFSPIEILLLSARLQVGWALFLGQIATEQEEKNAQELIMKAQT